MKQRTFLVLASALALVAGNANAQANQSPAGDPAELRQWIDAALHQRQPELRALYVDLHAHPELAFQESRTAGVLAARMRDLGFEVTEGVGGTGVVAMLRNGPGPVVMVRTDMDGLPLEEKTGLAYASRATQIANGAESFTMHACGHDMHMTWWIGAAELLSTRREGWNGTLMFIAQPAEEVLGGARAMLDDGLFTRFAQPDFAIAAHTRNNPAGHVTVKDGIVSSASDSWEITFHGRGGHGSMPSQTIDPIVIAAHFVSDVQSVVARERPEHEFGVISVGSFQAGTVANIIPDRAVLRLTLRSFTPAVRSLLNDGMRRTALASASMAGAPEPQFLHLAGAAPLVNSSPLVERAMAVLQPALGQDLEFQPAHLPGAPPSEDFSFYVAPQTGIPGLFLNIGTYSPARLADFAGRGEPVPTNHSPQFAPDADSAIAPGARALVLSVLSLIGA